MPKGSGSGERKVRRRFADGRGLYLILTEPSIPHRELVSAAVERSVPVVQLREKHLADEELVALALELREVTRGSSTLLIVNDRPDVALASGADGVHVGASDADPKGARLLLGDDAVVGVSGDTLTEARAAVEAGADYLGIGPVFPTSTKPDAGDPVGLEGLEAITTGLPELPTVAVGGIDASNVASVVEAGATYAAVVSAICFADDPVAAMDAILAELARVDRSEKLCDRTTGARERRGRGGDRGEESIVSESYDIDAQVNMEGLRFCPRCARELGEREVRGHSRLSCEGCGYVFYMAPAPVACVLVVDDARVLLVRRKYPPRTGHWCLPAGFIEVGEDPAESAARETTEETGLVVEITGLVGSWASGEDPRTPIVCYAFVGRVTGGTLEAGDDATEAAFFARDEIPSEIAFSTHRRLIESHFLARP
ncbi:MAG: thiamine phosphate synthase [Candidatus Eisenbacteria bacterium]